MKVTRSVLIVCLLLMPLAAQKVELKLDQLKSKAAEVSEQNLEGAALQAFWNTQLTALEGGSQGQPGRQESREGHHPREDRRTTSESCPAAHRRLFAGRLNSRIRTMNFR